MEDNIIIGERIRKIKNKITRIIFKNVENKN